MNKISYIDIFKIPKYQDGGPALANQDLYWGRERRKRQRAFDKARKNYRKQDNYDPNQEQSIGDAAVDALGDLPTAEERRAQAKAALETSAQGMLGINSDTFDDLTIDPKTGERLTGDALKKKKTSLYTAAAAGKALDIGAQVAGALTTGDKNFSEQSQAIDSAVGATTSKLMASGNPYLMAAAGGITAINELTKMGGQSVPGFEVDISSSGYGNLGSMEESSSRGLFFKTANDQKRLDNRNEKASLALAAASISEDQTFQQEARMNSLDNVVQNNEWALNGGVSTDLLAAKHGAKLNKVEEHNDLVEWMVQQMCSGKVEYAKNGAKLNGVEVSDQENVLPTGDLHKNKHNLDLDNITKKGIPVIQNIDDSVQTFAEVKQHEADIVQSAEIESLEIILNKEVTDFIEERMDKAQDREVCKEVGLRLCKEILFNTKDKEGLINNINEKENGRMDAAGLA